MTATDTPTAPPPTPEPDARHKPRWWRKTWLKVTAGFVGGLLVGSMITTTPTEPAAVDPGREATLDQRETELDAREAELEELANLDADLDLAEPAAEPEPQFYTPKPRDFDLIVKTTDKDCFGSAGCSVDYRIDPEYGGEPLDPSKTYEVTFELQGQANGYEAVGSILVNGVEGEPDQFEYEVYEGFTDTDSSDAELTAKVIAVEERGF